MTKREAAKVVVGEVLRFEHGMKDVVVTGIVTEADDKRVAVPLFDTEDDGEITYRLLKRIVAGATR